MTAPLSLEEIAAIEANAPGSHPNSVSYVARWELLSLCALAREALEARDRLKLPVAWGDFTGPVFVPKHRHAPPPARPNDTDEDCA
jgi:hypothetical protein